VDPGVYLFIYSPADLRIQLVFADFSVGKKTERKDITLFALLKTRFRINL
jgi:hypothetical protein